MTDFLLVAPILVPLTGGVLLVAVWGRVRIARAVSLLTVSAVAGLAFYTLFMVRDDGILASSLGDWPGPFGIVLVADLFSTLMVSATALVAIASLGFTMLAQERWQERYIYPFMLLLLAGVNGVFMTGDIFNLFVFFEVTLLASYALMAIGGRKLQMEAAFKYVVINVLASTFLLIGIGLLYGELGTLNMAHLSIRVASAEDQGIITAVAVLLLVAFGIKAAVIPLHFWLPGAYSHIPSGVAVFFGGVLTVVGVYSMVRVFTLVLGHDQAFFQPILLTMAGLSMWFGALGAIAQRDFRTLLSWDIISQVGYMIMGLALFTVASVSAAIFFILQYMLVKAALFLVAGSVERLKGTGDLYRLGGLARVYPLLAASFLIPALSLAGVPPFSGFWGKLALLQASFDLSTVGGYAIGAVALAASLMTLFVMFKVWQWVFWGEAREDTGHSHRQGSEYPLLVPIALVGLVTVVLAFAAGGLHDITTEAARQLMDPTEYIDAVNLLLLE